MADASFSVLVNHIAADFPYVKEVWAPKHGVDVLYFVLPEDRSGRLLDESIEIGAYYIDAFPETHIYVGCISPSVVQGGGHISPREKLKFQCPIWIQLEGECIYSK